MKQMNVTLLRNKNFGPNKTAYDAIKQELKVLKTLEHPNTIYLYEIIENPKKDELYLITEYYSKGSLANMISKLNAKDEQHNKLCIKEGSIEEMKTVGIRPW